MHMLDRRYINLEYILVKSQYIYEYVILQPLSCMILVDSDAYIIIKFVDIEVCDLNPTVSPEPILSAH